MILAEIGSTFAKNELLCSHLNATPQDLEPLLHAVISKSKDYDFSMAWINEKGEPVSIITNLPYKDY